VRKILWQAVKINFSGYKMPTTTAKIFAPQKLPCLQNVHYECIHMANTCYILEVQKLSFCFYPPWHIVLLVAAVVAFLLQP